MAYLSERLKDTRRTLIQTDRRRFYVNLLLALAFALFGISGCAWFTLLVNPLTEAEVARCLAVGTATTGMFTSLLIQAIWEQWNVELEVARLSEEIESLSSLLSDRRRGDTS